MKLAVCSLELEKGSKMGYEKISQTNGLSQYQFSVFKNKWIDKKETFPLFGSHNDWILKSSRTVRILRHYWNKDLMLNVKHLRIKLLISMKRVQDTSGHSRICSLMSGVIFSSTKNNSISANKMLCKWLILFMISEESSWRIKFLVKQVWQQIIIVISYKKKLYINTHINRANCRELSTYFARPRVENTDWITE